MYNNELAQMMPLIIFLIAFYGVLIVVGLASYILQGLGILRLSESRGLSNGWLGFIPYAKEYQLGKISGEIKFGKKTIKNPGIWLALIPLIAVAIFFGAYFALIFSVIGMTNANPYAVPDMTAMYGPLITFIIVYLFFYAAMIFILLIHAMVYYKIFACYSDGQQPVFRTALSLFVPLAGPILLYKLGKQAMINPPEYMQFAPAQPPYGNPAYYQQPQGQTGYYGNYSAPPMYGQQPVNPQQPINQQWQQQPVNVQPPQAPDNAPPVNVQPPQTPDNAPPVNVQPPQIPDNAPIQDNTQTEPAVESPVSTEESSGEDSNNSDNL